MEANRFFRSPFELSGMEVTVSWLAVSGLLLSAEHHPDYPIGIWLLCLGA